MEQRGISITFTETEEKKDKRTLPLNDLDLQMMLIEPKAGKDEIPTDFKNMLKVPMTLTDEKGNKSYTSDNLWAHALGLFTSDVRLGNVQDKAWNPEMTELRHNMNLSTDCFRLGYKRAGLASYSRGLCTLETSQSHKGFLRKIIQTTREETYKEESIPKKSIFGMAKKADNI